MTRGENKMAKINNKKNISTLKYFVSFILLILFIFIYDKSDASERKWIPFGPDNGSRSTNINVLTSDKNRTILEITFAGMYVDKITYNKSEYQIIEIPECKTFGPIGKPANPKISKMIGIPPHVAVKVIIQEKKDIEFSDYYLYPQQNPEKSDNSFFDFDSSSYSVNTFLPEKIDKLSDPGIWRDIRVILLNISPVQFNPTTKKIRVFNYLRVELVYDNSPTVNPVSLLDGKKSRAFSELQKNFIINYDFLQNGNYLPKTTSGAFPHPWALIICGDIFYPDIQAFSDWTSRKGIKTTVVKMSEIGTTSDDVYNYIKNNFYDIGASAVDYVILVGDKDFIPVDFHITPNYNYECENDYNYTLMDPPGEYWTPDIFIGRLSVKTVEELNVVLKKIMEYQIEPYTESTQWFNNATVVAGEGGGDYFVEWSRERYDYLINKGFDCDTLFATYGPINQDIKNNVNEG